MLTRLFARGDLAGHAAPTADSLPALLALRSVSGEPPQLAVSFELDVTSIDMKCGVRWPLKAPFTTPIVSSAC